MLIPEMIRASLGEKSLILRSLSALKEKVEQSSTVKKSGTTIIAMHYKDGVIMAADRRTTDWHIHTDDAVKIEETDNGTAIGCAGTVAFIQDLKETLLHMMGKLENLVEKPIYVDGQAILLKNILKANLEHYGAWIYVLGYAVPILAGYHAEEKRGFVFGFDEAGGIYEKSNYVTTGSGGQLAWGVLADRWHNEIEESDAVDLVIRALTLASFDNYSSHPLLAPSTVLVISKQKGIQYLEEQKALGMAYTIHREYLGRHGKINELKFFQSEEGV